MPIDLPSEINEIKNRLETESAWLWLLAVTISGVTETLRLVNNLENIVYDGNTYTRCNFTLGPWENTSAGQLPRRTLSITNVDLTAYLLPYVKDYEGIVGATIVITPVNSFHLDVDMSSKAQEYQVIQTVPAEEWIVFTLGAPNPLQQRFPLHRYLGLYCNFHFESFECSYTRKTVAGVTLSGSNPVSIEVTAHGFATGDSIRLAAIAGITPSLADSYDITKTDDNNFTLDSTDSSSYSGSYTSGGTAGYSTCERTLKQCTDRENQVRFGGQPGIRSKTVRFA